MLIKERRTLWFGRHPSAQAVWNLTAAWANGASYAFGETRHETQRRVLMSLADLSGTQDEWERWREHTEREEGAALGGRWFIFFGNFKRGKRDPSVGKTGLTCTPQTLCWQPISRRTAKRSTESTRWSTYLHYLVSHSMRKTEEVNCGGGIKTTVIQKQSNYLFIHIYAPVPPGVWSEYVP